MSYQALLFCPDEKTARTVTQVLRELDFSVEAVAEPFAVVKKLMAQHYDAIVADCENEQNASLIFKSARNSTSNQSSLFVAVVEGQAGVAKAFRIGANLVLTKPINIEQSKGTLRVARGLLRKNADSAKAAATQTSTSPASAATSQPPAPPRPVPVSPVRSIAPPEPVKAAPPAPNFESTPMAPAAFAGANELETEPEIIELDATDTAMLESLGNTVPPAAPTPASQALEVSTPAAKSPVVMPISTPNAGPVAPTSPSFDKATSPKPSTPVALPRPFLAPKSVGHGAAAAPAPAKEPVAASPVELPVVEAARAENIEVPSTAVASSSAPAFGSSPFATLDSPKTKTKSDSGSKTPFIAVAAVLVLGTLAYFGYNYLHGKGAQSSSNSAVTTTSPQAAPAATTTPVADATVTANPLPEPGASATSALSLTPKVAPGSQVPAPKPAAANLIAPDKTVSLESSPAIVVKTNPRPAASLATPQDQASEAAPAPLGVAMGSGNQDKTLSSIVSSAPAVPTAAPPQVVNISQGVSQGLLLKRVQPSYPPQAVSLRIEGAVNLQATIAKDGTIKGVKVLGGHPLLARAAADAVRQWRYKPYMLNGQPFEVQTEITVNFKLPN